MWTLWPSSAQTLEEQALQVVASWLARDANDAMQHLVEILVCFPRPSTLVAMALRMWTQATQSLSAA